MVGGDPVEATSLLVVGKREASERSLVRVELGNDLRGQLGQHVCGTGLLGHACLRRDVRSNLNPPVAHGPRVNRCPGLMVVGPTHEFDVADAASANGVACAPQR